MFLMRYGVIEGNLIRGLESLLIYLGNDLQREDVQIPEWFGAQMPLMLFILLVLSTVLIAAGGNVINDYFDTRIDRINKPDQVIVGRKVKRRVAMTTHLILSSIGALIGVAVAWRAGMVQLVAIPAFAIAALWLYSTLLKRRLLIGNLTVAVLTALVPLTVGLYEIPMLQRSFQGPRTMLIANNSIEMIPVFHELWYWIFSYSMLAFLGTLVRELQKDMADVPGDLAGGCRTVPIVWGMK
ncbi:MAG: geranylgeranylglycerol-phosphate geranylgeranyltransferase, partial [Bacteroidota bacterium]|nr:geranylgeranylglycerol-phosphate geranylgeranyltransferase [Bacteroidota bacterium]